MTTLIVVVSIAIIIVVAIGTANRLSNPYRVTVLYKNSPHKMKFNTAILKYSKTYGGAESFEWNQLEPKVKPLKLGADDVLAVYVTRRLPFFLIKYSRAQWLKDKGGKK